VHPRIEELVAYLGNQRGVLRAAVDSVAPDARERPPAHGGWSVANILEHLSVVEHRIARLLSSTIAVAQTEGLAPETSVDPLLPALVAERAFDRSEKLMAPEALNPTGLSAAAAWDALEKAGAEVHHAVLTGDGLALGTLTHPHPIFGPITVYEWIAFVGAHEGRHANQIMRIAASASRT
jgi:hypothetical protein